MQLTYCPECGSGAKYDGNATDWECADCGHEYDQHDALVECEDDREPEEESDDEYDQGIHRARRLENNFGYGEGRLKMADKSVRERFEKAAKRLGYALDKCHDGLYESSTTDDAWQLVQAFEAGSASAGMQPQHVTRMSDSSLYDEVCINCGATDANGVAKLNAPCLKATPAPVPDESGFEAQLVEISRHLGMSKHSTSLDIIDKVDEIRNVAAPVLESQLGTCDLEKKPHTERKANGIYPPDCVNWKPQEAQ